MKKAKATGTPAKPAKKAPAKAATKKTASKPAKKKAVTKKAAAAPAAAKPSKSAAPAKKAPAKKAPATKKPATPAAPAPTVTSVIASIDVGFGNRLYIRGEGPGLSWESGKPMDCESSDAWVWSTKAASRPFPFKVLINDEQWCSGEDFVAAVGEKNTVVPTF